MKIRDDPVSITHVLSDELGLLVNIKSMELGFSGFLKRLLY